MAKAQTDIRIRPREPHDDAAIAAVIARAFGPGPEGNLVKNLRRDGDCVCELVALDRNGAVAGHLLFSRLDVRACARTLKAVALAPLSVDPNLQRQGIGDALTQAGLSQCRINGAQLVLVLGHAKYYTRFGFSALLAKLLDAPYSGNSFMALEFNPGAVDNLNWKVTYPRAFSSPQAH